MHIHYIFRESSKMLVVFIHSLEIALVSLLAVLGYKVHYLYLSTNYGEKYSHRPSVKAPNSR